jgi:malonyl CoA-acyl carrier protein transacylase
MMSSSKRAARIARFQREQAQRMADQLQHSIEDLERLAAKLDREIRAEEERTRNSDPSDIAYSMRAKAARARRENLRRSSDELRSHLKAVLAALDNDQRSAA